MYLLQVVPGSLNVIEAIESGFLEHMGGSSSEYSLVLSAIWTCGGFVFMMLFMYISWTLFSKMKRDKMV